MTVKPFTSVTTNLTGLLKHATERDVPSDTPLIVSYYAPHWTGDVYEFVTRDTLGDVLDNFAADMEPYTDTVEATVYHADSVIMDNGEVFGIDGYPLAFIQRNIRSDFGWTIEQV